MKIFVIFYNRKKKKLLPYDRKRTLALSKVHLVLLRIHNTETALTSFLLQAFSGAVATRYYAEVTNAFMILE